MYAADFNITSVGIDMEPATGKEVTIFTNRDINQNLFKFFELILAALILSKFASFLDQPRQRFNNVGKTRNKLYVTSAKSEKVACFRLFRLPVDLVIIFPLQPSTKLQIFIP